jgi:3-hydroxybutyryl-CoA dehydrogenase
MMTEDMAHVCVVGAGTMGRGIAQVAISAGHLVSLVDPDAEQIGAATADIVRRLSRKEPDAEDIVRRRLATAATIADTPRHPNTVVIEAVVEDLKIKQTVFRESLTHFGAGCILATNTSSLSVSEIAAGTNDPSRVVGMHFFNPVPAMRLVEVVYGLQTDPAVVDAISGLAASWGKQVARVRSAPGFIVNRVARPFYGEALRLFEEGAASPETIDEVLRSAGQFRMGPFELMDLIGNDVNFAVTATVWSAFNFDPRFAPSAIQRELVAAGRFGRKTGRGFYQYGADAERPMPEPARSRAACPDDATLYGACPQLESLLNRAGIAFSLGEPRDCPCIEIPGLGTVVVTRGRTAGEESTLRGEPVLVLDRCLDPAQTTALALASTDESLTACVVAMLERAGVRAYPVVDTPGLIAARIVSMIANEAWEAAHHGIASPEDIDAAMVLGTNYPVGPFQWCERWSLASLLQILDTLWSEYRDPRYRASHNLRSAARTRVARTPRSTGLEPTSKRTAAAGSTLACCQAQVP